MKKFVVLVLAVVVSVLTNCATAESHAEKGWELFKRGGVSNHLIALQEYNKAIKMASTNADLYFQRGHIHRAMGNDDLALNDYQKTLEINPQGSYACAYIGEIYFDKKENDLALEYYNKSIAIRSDNEIAIAGIKKIEDEKAKVIAEEEKRKAEETAKAERIKALDEKARNLAKGYIYHDQSEKSQSAKLFEGGALEDGHAYYISNFVTASGGNMAYIFNWAGSKNYVMVEYLNQKVRGEVASNQSTILDLNLGVTVVVAGGKPPLYTPVVLGFVE